MGMKITAVRIGISRLIRRKKVGQRAGNQTQSGAYAVTCCNFHVCFVVNAFSLLNADTVRARSTSPFVTPLRVTRPARSGHRIYTKLPRNVKFWAERSIDNRMTNILFFFFFTFTSSFGSNLFETSPHHLSCEVFDGRLWSESRSARGIHR